MHRESRDPADPITATELAAQDRVRRELAALGADTAHAPPVPADVTAAIEAALRDAPAVSNQAAPVPNHVVAPQVVAPQKEHRRHSHRPLRWRRVAAAAGLLAVVLALGIGVFALTRGDADVAYAPDHGPTARHITAHRAPAGLPLTNPQILQLLQQPADLGALAEPKRCLRSLGYADDTPILGAQPVALEDRPAILLVLPASEPASVTAVVVGANCPTSGTGILARTELARP